MYERFGTICIIHPIGLKLLYLSPLFPLFTLFDALQLATRARDLYSEGTTAVVHGCLHGCLLMPKLGEFTWAGGGVALGVHQCLSH